jgi:hypothetical protein
MPTGVAAAERGHRVATAEEHAALQALASCDDLTFEEFYEHVFSIGYMEEEGVFGMGAHHHEWCRRLPRSTLTCTIAPRGSLKSTLFRAYLAYCVWQLPVLGRNIEALYFSYIQKFAGQHTEKAKQYIDTNPLYLMRGIVPLRAGKTVLRYMDRRTGKRLSCQPVGMMAFKRGLRADVLLLDDVLTDPRKPLDVSQIAKITRIFQQEIRKIAKVGRSEIHIAGTPQDETDLLFHVRENPKCDWQIYPAVDEGGRLLWPEVLTSEVLAEDLQAMGRIAFAKEMLCKPARSVEGFFQRSDFNGLIVTPKSDGYPEFGGFVVGGWDLGKKRHPAHISVLRRLPNGHEWQRRSIWMDGWEYSQQLELVKRLIAKYHIRSFAYDNTRGELEALAERSELPSQMVPVVLSSRNEWKIATDLDIEVTNRRLHLLDETGDDGYDRQLEQILAVDGALDAMETPHGHGDSFWSNALAVFAAKTVGRSRGWIDLYFRGLTKERA